MPRSSRYSIGAIGFIAFAAFLGAVVQYATHKVAQRIESHFGYTPDPDGTKRFLSELDKPLFAQAGEEAIREAQGKDTFLYRSACKAHQVLYGQPWVVGRQGIGDCVSWGFSHAVWLAQCTDWETGRLANPPPFPCTESLYGGSRVEARGKKTAGYSDGSYGGAAAKWLRDWGVIYRHKYEGHDLTSYSADRAKDWGNWGNGGRDDNGKLDAVAKTHPAKHVALVRNFREAAAAIESGFPVAVCSGYSFSTTRDAQGFSARTPQGWGHCMALVAVRYDRPGLLCLNSWGPSWVSGPRWPEDMPDGSFWIDEKHIDGMLAGEDSFAVGSVDGFGWRDLHHGNWLAPARAEAASIFSLAP
jgi:hypothetical protein